MKTLNLITLSLACAVTLAAGEANQNGNAAPLQDLLAGTRAVQAEALSASKLLKSKSVNEAELRQILESKSTQVARLRDLAAAYEQSAPSLTPAQTKEWEQVKMKIELIDIFVKQKESFASGDLQKNRTMLRAHAEGIAKRAGFLEDSLQRLSR